MPKEVKWAISIAVGLGLLALAQPRTQVSQVGPLESAARVLRQRSFRQLSPFPVSLFGFQRKLRRLMPDVVFNLYDDVVHGALYDMRLAALVRMMGFPMTGSLARPSKGTAINEARPR